MLTDRFSNAIFQIARRVSDVYLFESPVNSSRRLAWDCSLHRTSKLPVWEFTISLNNSFPHIIIHLEWHTTEWATDDLLYLISSSSRGVNNRSGLSSCVTSYASEWIRPINYVYGKWLDSTMCRAIKRLVNCLSIGWAISTWHGIHSNVSKSSLTIRLTTLSYEQVINSFIGRIYYSKLLMAFQNSKLWLFSVISTTTVSAGNLLTQPIVYSGEFYSNYHPEEMSKCSSKRWFGIHSCCLCLKVCSVVVDCSSTFIFISDMKSCFISSRFAVQ